MNPTAQYLIEKYGLVMNSKQVAEAIGLNYYSFLNLRQTKKRELPEMTKKGGSKLVTSAFIVAKYIDSMGQEKP